MSAQNKKPVVGCGKSSVLNTKWCITPAIEKIIREAKKIEDDDDISSAALADWMNSLSDEETAEHERLFQAHEKADDELSRLCPLICEHKDRCVHPCDVCHKAVIEDRFVLSCTTDCDLYKANVASDRLLSDFCDSHGSHKCHECSYWGRDAIGKCAQYDRYVSGFSKACHDFYTETEDDVMIREKSGPYETDESRAIRLKWEADHKEELEAFRIDRRRNLAKQYAKDFVKPNMARALFTIGHEFIAKLYAEFPEEFASCPYPTFSELESAVKV